jgi:GTP-binding protein
MRQPNQIRNIAIIAHIDHGKTTLLDALLRQSNVFRAHEKVGERVMDSYDQEKERGITIFAKHTGVFYEDTRINIIDTPGHADFSGEVERVLGMVNSVLLLVDAQEGPMPQTRFVLSKALKMGLNPIVVVNKIDRPHANPDRALNLTFDLFIELGATDAQLDFRYCFASGLGGFACAHVDDPRENMKPLFDLILSAVPSPSGSLEAPFSMQVASVSYDAFLGRQATGRILNGVVRKGDTILWINGEGNRQNVKVTRLQVPVGLEKVEVEEAGVGEIVVLAGAPEVLIGDTLCDPQNPVQLPPIAMDEPTVSIDMMVNNSPFVGKEGKHVTMNKLRTRLDHEKRANISLKIEDSKVRDEAVTISGRGELHLSVLIEAMRREDFEMTISKPQVVTKTIDGVMHEPIERVHVEVPEEYSGAVIEELSKRKGEMQALSTNEHGLTAMEFMIPTRGLMGYRNDFFSITRGLGVLTSVFDHFAPWKGELPSRQLGVMIANATGPATPYAIFGLQDRGSLFVSPGDPVYEGMIVGQHCRDNDIVVNICREKQLTNIRAAGKDENILLIPPRTFTLERAIDFIENDELVEITPKSIRLRKRYLTENERKQAGRS